MPRQHKPPPDVEARSRDLHEDPLPLIEPQEVPALLRTLYASSTLDLMTIGNAAREFFGTVVKQKVERLIQSGQLRAYKIDGIVFVSRSDLADLAQEPLRATRAVKGENGEDKRVLIGAGASRQKLFCGCGGVFRPARSMIDKGFDRGRLDGGMGDRKRKQGTWDKRCRIVMTRGASHFEVWTGVYQECKKCGASVLEPRTRLAKRGKSSETVYVGTLRETAWHGKVCEVSWEGCEKGCGAEKAGGARCGVCERVWQRGVRAREMSGGEGGEHGVGEGEKGESKRAVGEWGHSGRGVKVVLVELDG